MEKTKVSPIKDIVLYHFPATRSARVRWLLLELKVPHKIKKVDLFENEEHMTKEFLAKNPNHNVPVLEFTVSETGERKTMLESAAMLIFLADIFTKPDGTKLAPEITDYSKRSEYMQMMLFGGSWMDMMLWNVRIHTHLLPKDMREQSVVKYWKAKFKKEVEPQLRDRLVNGGPYILGNEFTAADILIAYNLLWGSVYGMLTDPVLVKYLGMFAKRSAREQAFDDTTEFKLDYHANIMSPSYYSSKL